MLSEHHPLQRAVIETAKLVIELLKARNSSTPYIIIDKSYSIDMDQIRVAINTRLELEEISAARQRLGLGTKTEKWNEANSEANSFIFSTHRFFIVSKVNLQFSSNYTHRPQDFERIMISADLYIACLNYVYQLELKQSKDVTRELVEA